MRILYVINDLAYFRAHRERLATDMLEDGHDVVVASGDVDNNSKEGWNSALGLIELDLDKHHFQPLGDAKFTFHVLKTIRETKPDVIHCFTIKPILFGGLAAAMAKLAGRSFNLVWTFAGLGKVFEPTPGWKYAVRRWCVSNTLRLVSRFTQAQATFENTADRATIIARKIVSPSRTHTIRGTGIDLDLFSPPTTSDVDQHAPLTFLLACRLIAGKGVETYLEVAENLKAKGLPDRFLIAGLVDKTNPKTIDLQLIKSAEQKGAIEFLGPVPQQKMPGLLREIDVFCIPTQLREGLPRSILEATACGAAIIASNQVPMREIVQPNKSGWLIEPNRAGLQQAVEDAIGDPESTRNFGRRARKVLETLPVSTETIQNQFKNLYFGQ